MASPGDIRNLVDLSGVTYRNLELIVKMAVEYVEINRAEGLEVIGLRFERKPSSEPKAITLSLRRDGKGRESRQYLPPRTYREQLTLACFLFAVARYSDIGIKAHILCSDSRSRGDLGRSISTKHPKSKLQENLTSLLEDTNRIGGYRKMTAKDLPDELTSVQRQLIRRATSGRVSASSLSEIRKSTGKDDLDIFIELKSMEFVETLDQSLVPTDIEFRRFTIHEVADLIESNDMIQLKNMEIGSLENELFSTRKELHKVRNRSLWKRILNR